MTPHVIACGFILLLFAGIGAVADETVPLFDYRRGLLEYYAGTGPLGRRELEESCLVFFPERYAAHHKDAARVQADLKEVRQTVEAKVASVRAGDHRYVLLLRAPLGEYDRERQEFNFAVFSPRTCVDLGPSGGLPGSADGERLRSVMSRGVLFNKVHTIKLFFSNTEEFTVVPCPAGQAEALLERRAGPDGSIGNDGVMRMNLEILPLNKPENRKHLDDALTGGVMTGFESSYFLLARIHRIEVFSDEGLREKLGDVKKNNRIIELQIRR